jgi:hypothetical protein
VKTEESVAWHRVVKEVVALGASRLAAVVLLVGCTSEVAEPPEPVEIRLGDVRVAVQELSLLAESLRGSEAPAAIVVGSMIDPIEPSEPARYDSDGYWVEYPRHAATVVVSDSLGWTIDENLVLHGAADMAPTITDADGHPHMDYVLVEWTPPPERKQLRVGEFVLFVTSPGVESWTLIWRAELSEGTVSGADTVANTDVALEDLRR